MDRKRILFIRLASYFNEKNAHPENVMTPIDIAIMAAIAQMHGCQVFLIDTEAAFYSKEMICNKVAEYAPDVIVIKSKSPSKNIACELINLLATPNRKIVGVGQAFTFGPDFFFANAPKLDVIIKGEPEQTFEELIKDWNESTVGTVQRIGDKVVDNGERELLTDLDRLPAPKYDWFLSGRYYSFYPTPLILRKKMAFMMIGRGCPQKCIFCSPTLRNSYGEKPRTYSIGRIMTEIEWLVEQGVTVIQFRDDNFTYGHKFVENFCTELINRQIKIKWIVQTCVNSISEELLCLMKRAGCVSIGFGIESGSEAVLLRLNKKTDLNKAKKIFKACRRLGIKTVAFFLVGCPEETEGDFKKTYQLLGQLRPSLIQVAIFTPYPGSYAYEHMLPEEYKNSNAGFHHYNKIIYNFSRIDTARLALLQKSLYRAFIFNPRNWPGLLGMMGKGLFLHPRSILTLIRQSFLFLFKREK